MIMARRRFSDAKVFYDLWVADSSISGRPRDLKRKGLPSIARATPMVGIIFKGARARPLVKAWEKHKPVHPGHMALVLQADSLRNIIPGKYAAYYAVLRMRRILTAANGMWSKWTLNSARNGPLPVQARWVGARKTAVGLGAGPPVLR